MSRSSFLICMEFLQFTISKLIPRTKHMHFLPNHGRNALDSSFHFYSKKIFTHFRMGKIFGRMNYFQYYVVIRRWEGTKQGLFSLDLKVKKSFHIAYKWHEKPVLCVFNSVRNFLHFFCVKNKLLLSFNCLKYKYKANKKILKTTPLQ